MGKRRSKYYKKKRTIPEWNSTRENNLIIRNKIKKYINKKYKQPVNQESSQWEKQRVLTIPSSLTRKALTLNDKFLNHYDIGPNNTLGMQIENILLDVFKMILSKGYQIFHPQKLWLSATPDGFTLLDKIPVEIKTKYKGTISDVIKSHYYQLQMTIYCAESDKIIVMAYIMDKQFIIIELLRDDNFIGQCIPKLDIAFYQHIASIDNNILLNNHKINKHMKETAHENLSDYYIRKRKPIKKNIRFNDVTNKYVQFLSIIETEKHRYRYTEISMKLDEQVIWFASDKVYKKKIKKIKQVMEIQELIDCMNYKISQKQ